MEAITSIPDLIHEYTMTSGACIGAMMDTLHANDVKGIKGDIVECGVWKGGNLILARHFSPQRVVWGYDTFTGMPKPEKRDGAWAREKYRLRSQSSHMSSIPGQWLGIPLAEVRDNLARFDLLDDAKLRFVAGPVERTLLHMDNLPESISLLRLDTDWYSSTLIELRVLYPRLVPGGTLIVDDYGSWKGANTAFEEYFHRVNTHKKWLGVHAIMVVKPD